MGCSLCGDNTPTTNSGASGGNSARYLESDAYAQILLDLNCMEGQIEQLKRRTEQNDIAFRAEHPETEKDSLCPIQTCEPCAPIGGCGNTGQMAINESPSGNPVGLNGDSTCGINTPYTLGDKVAANASEIRLLQQRVTALEAQLFAIRNDAIKTVLLDLNSVVRGGLTLTGRTVYFTPGSYEAVINSQ